MQNVIVSKSVYDVFKLNSGHTFRTTEKLNAGDLSRPGFCFSPNEKVEYIYETIKFNSVISEFTIIEDNNAIGFFTRTAFNELLGGQYGYSLFSRAPIREIMKTDFLSVDYYMQVEQVSKLAMSRPFDQLYNPIVVEREGKYFGIVTVKDLLDMCRNIALAERDEIALMRDSLKIGIFFIDRKFTIQDQHSRYLEELFSRTDLCGKNFMDLLVSSVTPKELAVIKDYLNMVFENTHDQTMLDEINPLMEVQYIGDSSAEKKIFQYSFASIQRNNEDIFVLVSVYDITAKKELQQQLEEEESKRQEEMKTVFEFLQAEPQVFRDFIDDMEHEFGQINKILMNDTISAHEALVNIYQSVHSIKSNAYTLGQNTFGNKVHKLESEIKKLRDKEEVAFENMLNLTMEIEKLLREKDNFKTTIKRIISYRVNKNTEGMSQTQYILLKLLNQTVNRISVDLGKKVKFIVDKMENSALEAAPRRILKEVLIQLIRNSVAHGIESPEDRFAVGKKKTGIIRLSLKIKDDKIHVKLTDDGRGLDYEKIAIKARKLNLIKPKDMKNKKVLLKVIFSPGFSTAENEGIHAGRGIGLNLVHDRVRSNKGSIKLHSEPGKGTAFHICFPAGSGSLPNTA